MNKFRLLLAAIPPLFIGAIFLSVINASPPIPINQKEVIASSINKQGLCLLSSPQTAVIVYHC